MVYNSEVDELIIPKRFDVGTKFNHNGNEHFYRLYIKYPPEWNTSNVGEKIIGVRNMSFRWRDGDLQLMLYIRKYKRIIPRTVVDEDNLDAINAIDYEDLLPNMRIFGIPISIRISSNNTWDDIKEKIMSIIEQENLYNYIYKRLKSEFSVPANIYPSSIN